MASAERSVALAPVRSTLSLRDLFRLAVYIEDGVEGARRRIADAEQYVSDFGVGSYCGLGRPATATARAPIAHSVPPIPALRRATAETIGAVLDLHRSVAEL